MPQHKSLRLSVALLLVSISSTFAQSPTPDDDSHHLLDIIAKMDATTFDAFNAHNARRVMSLFTDDVDFYQDKGGASNYQQTA